MNDKYHGASTDFTSSGSTGFKKQKSTTMKTFAEILGYILLILLIALIIGGILSLGAFIFQFLWNAIIVALFSAPIVSFWQSMGLVVLLSFVGGIVRGNSK